MIPIVVLVSDAERAARLADITVICIGRPLENTYIIFEPGGRGRVAFGDELVTWLEVRNKLQPVPFARHHHQITAANASPACGRSARRAPR